MEYQIGKPEGHSTSNLAHADARMGARYEVGRGGLELTTGHGMVRNTGMEYRTAPTADPVTGHTFSTEAGLPVPGGRPRPHDMVEIGGMKVKVEQAVRFGMIADPFNAAPAQALNAPLNAPQHVVQADQSGALEAPENAAESFTADVLPRLSPATVSSLEADLTTGFFTEKTLDYLELEGRQSPQALDAVRDAYAAKITAATGLDEHDLHDLWQNDPARFAAAAGAMMKTGDTSAFQSLAEQADAAAYRPLDDAAATVAWRSPDFPQALIDAGLEPVFEGGEIAVNIPGRGVMKWTDAVSQGVVRVSRFA